jgi:hypothetical protein
MMRNKQMSGNRSIACLLSQHSIENFSMTVNIPASFLGTSGLKLFAFFLSPSPGKGKKGKAIPVIGREGP